MKNFYLFLAGIALLASGTHFISNFSGDQFQKTEKLAENAKNPQALAVKKERLPFSPLKPTQPTNHRFLIPGISATNTAALTNDTGLPGASAGDELEYTVTISNGGTVATGVVFTDQIDANTTLVPGSVKVSPIAVEESYTTIGNVGLDIPAGSGVLTNDISPSGSVLSIVGPTNIATTQGGNVTMNLTTGAFTYVPAAGFVGDDTFTYTLQNGSGLTSVATVTISSAGAIWFVNSAASPAGANGTLAKPFATLAAFQAINDVETGHSIFLYTGSYTGPVTLLSQQKLIGQGATESLLTITGLPAPNGNNLLPSTGGTKPILTSSGGANVINTGAGNSILGLSVGASGTGVKIAGSTAGTLTIKEVDLTGAGSALNLSNLTLAADFTEISSSVSSGISPIKIASTGGALKISSGIISSSNVPAIDIAGNSLALNVTFSSVSSTTASKGIAVSGTTGTFQVTGTGTTLGSGGTIQSITGRGVELINAAGITLKNMNLTNANTSEGSTPSALDNSNANAAIHANNVAGLSLDRIIISGTVVQEGINLRTVSNFNFTNGSVGKSGSQGQSEEGCIYAINTSGTNSITNSTFDDPGGRAAYFSNENVNMTLLTIDNSTFSNADNGPGVQVEGRGTSTMNVKIQNGCQFLSCRTSGVEVYANNTSFIQADIKGSTINVGSEVGTGIDIAASGNATAKFNVLNNTSNYNNGPCLNFFAFSSGYLEGNVTGNTVTKVAGGGSGIRFYAEGTTARGVLKIENNTINNSFDASGMNISGVSTAGARSDFTINNNNVNQVNPGSLYGIDVNAIGTAPTNSIVMCANVTNNDIVVASSTLNAARIRSGLINQTTILVQGSGGTIQDVWNNGGNTPINRASQSGQGFFTFGQTCAVPNVSPLARMAAEELAGGRIGAADEEVAKAPVTQAASVPVTIQEAPENTSSPAREQSTLSGETVTVNGTGTGFSIPANKNVMIKFKVTIDANIPTSDCEISNQGTVSGSNFTSVLTDDPGAAGSNNPTITAVTSTPVITFCPGNVVVNPDPGTCVSSQTFAATADGCPAPTIAYTVAGNPITFPFDFPSGLTTVLVTASNGIGTAPTCSFTVTVTPTPAPVLTDNPDPQSICVNGDASFTVATSATGVTYQWQKKPSGGSFANILLADNATANSATLSLTSVPVTDDQSEYQCIVSNPCTGSTSTAALLTVSEKPTIVLSGDEYQCSVDLLVYTVIFTASPGAVVTSDKGTVDGNKVTGIPNNQTAILTATNGGCSTTLSVFKDCSLPVTLIDFSAAKQENTILLKWRTSEETNSEKFDIEHSVDGKSWRSIGSQKSNGESATVLAYSFTDKEPSAGENLYRLKMVDFDQTYAYSSIVSVNFNIPMQSEFYPNPVSDQLYVKSSDWNQVSAIEMHNVQGRKVYKSGASIAKTIQVKDLPAGIYILSIIHKNGTVSKQKVLINR
ncbi:MAG: T9SS type A sorting domain-containing protein [Dyadobacter sp.]|uniref:Ig-like domain-containing protein n=1 Tax=Dyadobacter sp. TaxID=1914288 RepID=UPI003265D83C